MGAHLTHPLADQTHGTCTGLKNNTPCGRSEQLVQGLDARDMHFVSASCCQSYVAHQLSSLAVSRHAPSGDHFTPLRKLELGHVDWSQVSAAHQHWSWALANCHDHHVFVDCMLPNTKAKSTSATQHSLAARVTVSERLFVQTNHHAVRR